MKHSTYYKCIKLGILGAAMFTSACFFDSKDEYSADTVQAEAQKASAKEPLNNAMEGILSGENMDITNFDASDFKAANEHYNSAIKADKNDNEAKFGRALTGFMVALGEPQMKEVMNEVTGDQNPALEMTANSQSDVSLAVAKIAFASDTEFPILTQIQDDVSEVMLPALDLAIKDLESVVQDGDFKMEMTIADESRFVGASEANLLLAGLRLTRVQMILVLSRDFDIDKNESYNFLERLNLQTGSRMGAGNLTSGEVNSINHIISLLKIGSPFLTLREGWEARFATVLPELKLVTINFEDAVNQIKANSQFIISNEEIRMSDKQNLQDGIDSAQKYLENPFVFKTPAGDEISTYLPALLKNTDVKALFPYYDFYTSDQWENNGLLFFSDGQTKTGDINDITDIMNTPTTDYNRILKMKKIIHFQDPTFNGALPGMTRSKLWTIILNNAN